MTDTPKPPRKKFSPTGHPTKKHTKHRKKAYEITKGMKLRRAMVRHQTLLQRLYNTALRG